MNISSRRKRRELPYQRQPTQKHHYSFYFLSVLILLGSIGIDSTGANLYSEFSKDLDVLSNLAENKVKSETAPIIDEIYARSGKLLENPFVDVLSEEDMEKLERIVDVEKLTDVLEPEYSSQLDEATGKRIFRRQDDNEGKFEEERRNYRNIIGSNLGEGASIFRQNTGVGMKDNIWPQIAGTSKISFPADESSYLYDKQHYALKGKFRRSSRPSREHAYSPKKLVKRFDLPLQYLDPKSVLNTATSLYPGVMTKPQPELASSSTGPKLNMNGDNAALKLDLSAFAATPGLLNGQTPLPSASQMKEFQDLLLKHTPRQAVDDLGVSIQPTQTTNCDQMTNVSNTLERVLTELEKLKEAKMGNASGDGKPCNINGFWNSEVAGVRFDIAAAGNNATCPIDLRVDVQKRRWKSPNTLMDPSWTCRGSALKRLGGPFYLAAKNASDNGIATFTGFCMRCEGYDVVFGAWTFANPTSNCTDVSLAIDTKRDVFRRDIEEEKKYKEKEAKKKAKANKNCLSEESIEQDKNEHREGFSSDTFYEYF